MPAAPLKAVLMAAALALAPGWSSGAENAFLASSPFPSRPAPRGATLFTKLAPERTGVRVENRYDDPRMWGSLYQEFEGGSVGTGVAIGDFDGDGRPDIFVVTKTDGCRLYRNLGNYTFEDVTEKAGVGGEKGVWNAGATFVDINNDGRLDLYVCRYNAPNLLYVNQGDGTFREMAHAYGLDVRDASVMAGFCDYDRDGRLDVYITTNILDATAHPGGQRGHLLHNNGNGTFTDVTEAAGISGESQSHSAMWWDFDNDGWPDLYVANDYGVPDKLYRNNRDGTFTNVIDSVLSRTSYYSMGSDLGDVDNDGRIDLLVADMAATSRRKDQHSIAESRERSVDWPAQTAPKYPRSALYLNTGTGRCLEAAQLAGIAATDWTWSVRLEDLDNDGWLDLFVTNGFNRDPNPDVNSRSMNVESAAERIRILKDSPVLQERHLAFRNKGDLAFEEVSAAWGLDQKGVAFGAAFGDLGGTGNLDLVYTNYEGTVSILRNDCDSGHRINVELRGTASNRFGVGSVVRVESALGLQVRPLVLARGYMSSSEPMLHFGLGADTAVRRMTVTWPNGRQQVFENLPADRRYRVTEPPGAPQAAPAPEAPPARFVTVPPASGNPPLSREEEIDETYLQKLIPLRLNRRGPALAVADLLGNGREEAVIGATTLDPQHVVAATGPASYAAADGPVVRHPPADDGPLLLLDV
ncbi:MAG TPA: CRTAC1 family protein, partial [Opitutaceae bacterium]